MIRSHITQNLQNYFDENDTRVRRYPNTLDAQLLNAAAGLLEEHEMRLHREIRGRYPALCPLHLDNRGVYYKVQLPAGFQLQSDAQGNLLPPTVKVKDSGTEIQLQAFDDLLPVPAAIEEDLAQDPIPLASPKAGTFATTDAAPLTPGVLPIPNRLSFWLEGLGDNTGAVQVLVTGQPHPRNLWPGRSVQKTETLQLSSEGFSRTSTVWYAVDSVRVYFLPEGATLDVYLLDMGLPFTADPDRSYTHPDYRDALFPRYWQIGENELKEVYYHGPADGFSSGLPLVTSRQIDFRLLDLAIEPHTRGMFAIRDGALYYLDRREPMPNTTALRTAGLTAEPRWGLNVTADIYSEPARRALLQPEAYANAGEAVGYRFLMQAPDGGSYLINSTGEPVVYKPSDWINGQPPAELSVVLPEPGSYVFTLETRGGLDYSVSRDACPWVDLEFAPAATFSLGDLSGALGLAFDPAERLWIWDGAYLHRMLLKYDGFAFDPAGRALYLTQKYDEVILS